MKIFTATFKFKGSDGLGYFKDRIYRLNICDGLFVSIYRSKSYRKNKSDGLYIYSNRRTFEDNWEILYRNQINIHGKKIKNRF